MSAPHERRFDPARAERLDDPARRERMPAAAVRAALGSLEGKVVADVGAGTGYYTFALLDGDPPRAIAAVDVSDAMLSVLRTRLSSHDLGSRVELHVAPAERLPLADDSVDAVLLGNVYHELDDRAAALAEARRVLRSGGRLLIIDWSVPDDAKGAPVVGPPLEHRIPLDVVLDDLGRAGFAAPSLASGFVDVYAVVATPLE